RQSGKRRGEPPDEPLEARAPGSRHLGRLPAVHADDGTLALSGHARLGPGGELHPPAASARRRPRSAQMEKPEASAAAARNARPTSLGLPARRERPASSKRVSGLATATP